MLVLTVNRQGRIISHNCSTKGILENSACHAADDKQYLWEILQPAAKIANILEHVSPDSLPQWHRAEYQNRSGHFIEVDWSIVRLGSAGGEEEFLACANINDAPPGGD